MANTLTESAIRQMATEWFQKLDEHVREVDLLPYLVSEGLKQNWPDYKVESLGDFEGWYQRALRLFFDEVHTLKELTASMKPDGSAQVKVVVNWQASTWTPGDRNSKRLNMDAYQTWEVVASPQTGKPQIKQIDVDDIKLMPGSATL